MYVTRDSVCYSITLFSLCQDLSRPILQRISYVNTTPFMSLSSLAGEEINRRCRIGFMFTRYPLLSCHPPYAIMSIVHDVSVPLLKKGGFVPLSLYVR